MSFSKFITRFVVFCATLLAPAGFVFADSDEGIRPQAMCQNAPTSMSLQKGDYGVGVQNVQAALGIRPADGCFGNQTHSAVEAYQACHGLFVDGKVGPQTWRAINVGKTLAGCASVVAPSTSSTNTSAGGCSYNALTKEEVVRLLGTQGCSAIREFQRANGLTVDGIVGPVTARQLIMKSSNPCGLYGNYGDDCFLGIQRNGNLGTLYTVIDGEIATSMPARFGNPNRTNGKTTPEGAYQIVRSIPGDHAGEFCSVIGGVRQKCMRNPLYFYGGTAIHGTSAPQDPNGSLRCVGVSDPNSDVVYDYYQDGVKLVVPESRISLS